MKGIWTDDKEKINDYMFFCFPKTLYKTTNMNMFDCILSFILFILFDTLYTAICLLTQITYSIANFVYYICHVNKNN